jgi:hypothetical protein
MHSERIKDDTMEASTTDSPHYTLTVDWIPYGDFPFSRVEQKAKFSGVSVME